MKIIISDDNKKELLSTANINEAYRFLKNNSYYDTTFIPLKTIKNAIGYDKDMDKSQSLYIFYKDKEETQYISMEVFWDE